MSGIFGVYNRNGRPIDDGVIAAMQSAMANAEADGAGVWQNGSVGLGHQSLDSTPESLHESLPTKSRSGNQVLTASARLDNREDLFQSLNVPVADRSGMADSELMLLAYEEWGTDCPRHLLGDWSFGIWDIPEQRLFIARDQFGHAAVYYYQHREMFAFASTIKAVLAAPGVPHELNPTSLLQLTPGNPRDETTAYRGVLKLTPGRSMTITAQQVKHEQYWHPSQAPDIRFRRDEDYVEAFREVYSEAVRCRLRSHSGVGVTLSGGLDSGSVAAVAAQQRAASGQRLTGITSVPRFDASASDNPSQFGDERPYVELIRNHCSNIDVHYVTASDVSPLQGIRRFLDACSDPSVSPGNAFWLCGIMDEAKRRGIGTLLTGHAGNHTVSWSGNRDEYLASLLSTGRFLKYASEISKWKRTHRASLLKTLTNQVGRSLIPARLVRKFSRRLANSLPNALRTDFLKTVSPPDSAINDPPEFRTVHRNSAHRKMFGLMRTDGNAAWGELGAAYGINVTAPTIDVRVIEFCLGIPQDQYTRNGQRKLLIRRAMKGLLPQQVLWNERKGRQAGDIIQRVREHRDEFEAVLTDLRSSSLATEILDLQRMTDVHNRIRTDINPDLSRDTVLVLLRGLMIGLFLQTFDTPLRPSLHLKNAA